MSLIEKAKTLPIYPFLKDFDKTFWLVIGATTAGAVFIRGIKSVWNKILSFFTITVEITSRDDSYEWIIEWLHSNEKLSNYRRLTAITTYFQYDEGDNRPIVMLVPDVGNYLIKYKGKRIWLKRARDESYSPDTLAKYGGVFETIHLTCFGNDKSILLDLINTAMEVSQKKEEDKTVIYTSMNGYWQKFGSPRPIRPLNSVILDENIKENIMKDINEFLSSSSWYKERGIPYRRGYLLYGPPGTGKTSFVTSIAGALGMAICVINLNNSDISDEQLVYLFSKTPSKKCIILIEDIDDATSSVTRNQKSSRGISLSGLLNAIDGVTCQDGRLLFLTTNHIENIDSALIRPGRVDVKVELGLASRYQMENLFLNFYPGRVKEAKAFANSIEPNTLSMALIQGYFMIYKDSPEDALKNVGDILKVTNGGGSS